MFKIWGDTLRVYLDHLEMHTEDRGILSDEIVYDITVENKGNVTLSDLELKDHLQEYTLNNSFILDEQSAADTNLDIDQTYYYTLLDGVKSIEATENKGVLAPGEKEIYKVRFTVDQAAIDSKILLNSVEATASSPPDGEGDIQDISDGDSDPLLDSEYIIDGITDNDPTVTILQTNPSLEVIKTVSAIYDSNEQTRDIGSNVDLGDRIVYSITVTNTGDTNITDIDLVDQISDSNGNVLRELSETFSYYQSLDGLKNLEDYYNALAPTEYVNFTVNYTVDSQGYGSEFLSNSVTATGSTGGETGNVVDISDDGDTGPEDTGDDPTIVFTSPNPKLQVVKTAEIVDANGDNIYNDGDIVNFNIKVTNTGNREISSIEIVDTLKNNASTDVTSELTGPFFTGSSLESDEGTLKIGEVAEYFAFYVITEDDANSGKLINTVTATGSSPGNTDDVFDESDDGNELFDGPDEGNDPTDDPTVVNINSDAAINVVKTIYQILDSPNDASAQDGIEGNENDVIVYHITVENVGNPEADDTTLKILDFEDILINGNWDNTPEGQLQYDYDIAISNSVQQPPVSTKDSLLVGDKLTFEAYYTITAADVVSELLSNQVNVTAQTLENLVDVSDLSDDGDDFDGNTFDDPTEFELTIDPSIEVTKTYEIIGGNNDVNADLDEVVKFTIAVENTGNVILSNFVLEDTFTDISGTQTLSLSSDPEWNFNDDGTIWTENSDGSYNGTLKVGATATYEAFYTIKQPAIDLGGIRNKVKVYADPPIGDTIFDDSDDGDDDDENLVDDPTDVPITRSPQLSVTKVIDSISHPVGNDDTITDLFDTIYYKINVENTGNVTLTNVTIDDVLENADGKTLNLTTQPYWSSSDAGSPVGTLKPDEIAVYYATYTIDSEGADSGEIINTANVTASSPIADNDTLGSGSVSITTTEAPSIVVEKTYTVIENGITGFNPNDIIRYDFSVENTGNVTLTNVDFTDVFTNRKTIPESLDFTNGPFYTGASLGSADGTLKPGEKANYMALFNLTQDVVDAGGLDNSVTFTAQSPDGVEVTDSDQAELIIAPIKSLEVIKSVETTDNNGDNIIGGDDLLEYTITVTNTGNVTLTDLTITDTFTDGDTPPNNLLFDDNTVIPQLTGSTDNTSNSTTLNVGETKTYTATYTVEESAAATGSIENQVLVQARSPKSATLDVNDLSDDPATETADDKTIVSTEFISDIKATKTYSVSDINNDNKTGAGDQVSYTVTVENKGNTVLDSLVINDTFKNGDGVQLYFDMILIQQTI